MNDNSLVDIGVNLTHRQFSEDRAAVMNRAIEAGVTGLVLTGVNLEESEAAAAVASDSPQHLRSTAGVHPHYAKEWNAQSEARLHTLLQSSVVTAVGETGLDYFRDFSPRPDQQRAFEAQLEVAAQTGYPVFLHQRDADEDFLAIIRQHRDTLSAAILHCFTGDKALLHACLDLGLHIGVTGWVCDERRGQSLRECVPDIPTDRLMIETDAPFLLPRDLPERPENRRNEPAFLPHILRSVAELKGLSPEALAVSTRQNARDFFAF